MEIKFLLIASLCFMLTPGSAAGEDEVSPEVLIDQQEVIELGCRLVFDHNDDLWLFDENGELINVTNSGDVFTFTADPFRTGLIYYSVLDEDLDMDVYALWMDSEEEERIGRIENETEHISYFVTETYFERAAMMVECDVLRIECDFRWDWYDFSDFKTINLVPVRGKGGEVAEEPSLPAGIQIENRIIGGISELVCITGDTTYQLTDTRDIPRYEDYYLEEPIGYQISPSGDKVLCSLITAFGDLAHGPMLIVNIDGSNQQELVPDMMFWNFHYGWAGNTLVYVGFEEAEFEMNLYAVSSEENVPELMVPGVNHFELIQNPSLSPDI